MYVCMYVCVGVCMYIHTYLHMFRQLRQHNHTPNHIPRGKTLPIPIHTFRLVHFTSPYITVPVAVLVIPDRGLVVALFGGPADSVVRVCVYVCVCICMQEMSGWATVRVSKQITASVCVCM